MSDHQSTANQPRPPPRPPVETPPPYSPRDPLRRKESVYTRIASKIANKALAQVDQTVHNVVHNVVNSVQSSVSQGLVQARIISPTTAARTFQPVAGAAFKCPKCQDTGWKPSGRVCRRCPFGESLHEALKQGLMLELPNGEVQIWYSCPQCKGTGLMPEQENVHEIAGILFINVKTQLVPCTACTGTGKIETPSNPPRTSLAL